MVSSIQLGNVSNQNGKTVITGSSSGGLDTEGLIESLTEAKRLPAVQLESRIEENAARSSAFGELQTILTRFKDAANFLRNVPGVGKDAENIFSYRQASLNSNTSIAADTYLDVTVEPGSDIQSFSIDEITNLATAAKQTTNDFTLADTSGQAVFAAPGAGQFGAGTISIRHIDGVSADVDITLADGDSLQDVANAFNVVKEQTGVQANILKVADGAPNSTYKIVFSALETGTNYDFALDNVSTVTADPGGVLTNLTFSTTPAENASLIFDGITISRQSNDIDDLIDGITFSLKQETPALTTINMDIEPDTELAKTAILNFVDSYNELRIFSAGQTEIGDDGLPTESAILAGSSTLRTTLTRINTEMSAVIDGLTGGDPARLSDIGLTFTDFPGDEETPFVRNIITVDEADLDSALAANFDDVRRVFEFDYTADDPDLVVFSRTNNLDVSSISLNIDQTNGIYQATYTDSGGSPVTIDLDGQAFANGSGVTLRGQDGSVLEGLVLLYANTSDATVNLNMTQGVGDRVYNTIDEMLDSDNGSLVVELETIEDNTTRLEEEIARIDSQIERYREQLLNQFSALEQAIATANVLLQSLSAQADARAAAG